MGKTGRHLEQSVCVVTRYDWRRSRMFHPVCLRFQGVGELSQLPFGALSISQYGKRTLLDHILIRLNLFYFATQKNHLQDLVPRITVQPLPNIANFSTTAGSMPPPTAKPPVCQNLGFQEYFVDQECLDKPKATSNLLKKSEFAARTPAT